MVTKSLRRLTEEELNSGLRDWVEISSHSLNQEIQEEEEHIWRQKTLGFLQDEQADMNLVIRRKARNTELRAVMLTVVASVMDLSEGIQEWGSS